MSGNAIPRTYLQAVACNGIGRYVPQLQRLTFKFCKSKQHSCGIRDYIEHDLVDFCRQNPSTAVYVKPRRHRYPLIVAEYLCGNWQYLRAERMEREEIFNWVEFLRTRSGLDIMPIYKYWATKSPSIQGMWHPFSDTDKRQHPGLLDPHEIVANLKQLSRCPPRPDLLSADDRLLHLDAKSRQSVPIND